MGLLAIIAVSLAGVFTHLLNASAKNTDLTAARVLASTVLDRAVRSGPPTFGFSGFTGNTARLRTQDADSLTEFVYDISPARLKLDNGMVGVNRELYYIEVEVRWAADSGQVEKGVLSTKVSQTASYEN